MRPWLVLHSWKVGLLGGWCVTTVFGSKTHHFFLVLWLTASSSSSKSVSSSPPPPVSPEPSPAKDIPWDPSMAAFRTEDRCTCILIVVYFIFDARFLFRLYISLPMLQWISPVMDPAMVGYKPRQVIRSQSDSNTPTKSNTNKVTTATPSTRVAPVKMESRSAADQCRWIWQYAYKWESDVTLEKNSQPTDYAVLALFRFVVSFFFF